MIGTSISINWENTLPRRSSILGIHRQSFLGDVLELGFSIHDLHEDGPEDFPFVACLERDDNVDYGSINSVVLELFRLTENHHGTYDGWETQVVEGCESSDCE